MPRADTVVRGALQRSTAPWRAAAIGAAVAALMLFPGLGSGTLWDNSETAYGEIAREILLTHDAVVMHLNLEPWFIQPPLYFWLGALAAKLFGLTSFALRLPAALATIAAAGVTAYAVARAATPRAGVLASIALTTSLMQAIVGRLAIMDALLDLGVTVAILGFHRALAAGSARGWYAGCAAVALATLAKGIVAPVVVVLVAGSWHVWQRRAGTAAFVPPAAWWLGGGALGLAIVLPWPLLELHATGPAAFGELVGHYTVGRYLGTIENQTGPLWYYVPVVILGFFPWVAYLAPATRAALADRDPGSASLSRLAIVWALVPLVFFSFAKTKLPNYVALELPALALLVGLWLDREAFARGRRVALAWTAVVPVAFIALIAGMFVFSNTNRLGPEFATMRGDLFTFVGTNLVGSLLCFALFARPALARLAPFALATSTVAAWLFVALVGEPHAERFKPVPKLAAIVNTLRQPTDLVAIQGVAGGNALLFYSTPRVRALAPFGADFERPEADPQRAICEHPRALVIGAAKRPADDPTFGRTRHIVATEARDVLVLYDGPACSRDARHTAARSVSAAKSRLAL